MYFYNTKHIPIERNSSPMHLDVGIRTWAICVCGGWNNSLRIFLPYRGSSWTMPSIRFSESRIRRGDKHKANRWTHRAKWGNRLYRWNILRRVGFGGFVSRRWSVALQRLVTQSMRSIISWGMHGIDSASRWKISLPPRDVCSNKWSMRKRCIKKSALPGCMEMWTRIDPKRHHWESGTLAIHTNLSEMWNRFDGNSPWCVYRHHGLHPTVVVPWRISISDLYWRGGWGRYLSLMPLLPDIMHDGLIYKKQQST